MITVYTLCGLALVALCGCCFVAGQIYERTRIEREDYNQRDAWAARYEQEHEGAA